MDKILLVVQMLVRLFIPEVTSAKGSVLYVKDILKVVLSTTTTAAVFAWVYQELLVYYSQGGDNEKVLLGTLVIAVLKAVVEGLRQWANGPDVVVPPAPPAS